MAIHNLAQFRSQFKPECLLLCRVPVRPEGPGEGLGDPSAAAGRLSGRVR